MDSGSAAVALLAVGLVLVASGGWLAYVVEECRGTKEVRVTTLDSTPPYEINPTPYEDLSDRQRGVFDRGIDASSGWTTADRDVEMPTYVEYQDRTYEVAMAHPDDCGRPIGELLAWGALAGGIGALALGGRTYWRTSGAQ